eukprot:m.104889 g.104889  ORF g.104889 m.104889 type:complete len:193 (+) comp27601_c0_seq1:3-581(+)
MYVWVCVLCVCMVYNFCDRHMYIACVCTGCTGLCLSLNLISQQSLVVTLFRLVVIGDWFGFAEVYVCSGPLFLPSLEANGENWVKYQVIGESHVAVPTHFFKIIVWGGSPLSVNRHGIKEDNDTSNNNSATNTPSTTNTNNDTSLMIACYLVPNSKTLDKNSRMQLVPIEVIERASGYRFFCRTDSPTLIAS